MRTPKGAPVSSSLLRIQQASLLGPSVSRDASKVADAYYERLDRLFEAKVGEDGAVDTETLKDFYETQSKVLSQGNLDVSSLDRSVKLKELKRFVSEKALTEILPRQFVEAHFDVDSMSDEQVESMVAQFAEAVGVVGFNRVMGDIKGGSTSNSDVDVNFLIDHDHEFFNDIGVSPVAYIDRSGSDSEVESYRYSANGRQTVASLRESSDSTTDAGSSESSVEWEQSEPGRAAKSLLYEFLGTFRTEVFGELGIELEVAPMVVYTVDEFENDLVVDEDKQPFYATIADHYRFLGGTEEMQQRFKEGLDTELPDDPIDRDYMVNRQYISVFAPKGGLQAVILGRDQPNALGHEGAEDRPDLLVDLKSQLARAGDAYEAMSALFDSVDPGTQKAFRLRQMSMYFQELHAHYLSNVEGRSAHEVDRDYTSLRADTFVAMCKEGGKQGKIRSQKSGGPYLKEVIKLVEKAKADGLIDKKEAANIKSRLKSGDDKKLREAFIQLFKPLIYEGAERAREVEQRLSRS